ncbi:hypothetical protein BG261_02225 [Floricoccus tropicus]|uniref:HTH lysR-type domain-containing protein n=1 Tax=Floricoccus tropicus TaxID=1859473 RepID=A0A1E8GN18_9LACT|nr:LysR family transcriptional regulator [Floricoccus tropicus]OFI49416.1 hypothetical protein BG261_02225 [Floricoccus tropicus]
MELNDIIIFNELVNLESTIKVANKLSYVQSNISKRISKLEKELGTSLFERTNRGMILSSDGKRFLPYAKQMIQNYNDIKNEFLLFDEKYRIGATQSISKNYLQELYTDENYEIYTRSTTELVGLLHTCQIDFIIVNQEINDLDFKLLFTIEEKLIWVKSNLNDNNLKDCKVAISRDKTCPYRQRTLELINREQEGKVIEVDSLDILIDLMEKKNIISILPEKLITVNNKLTNYNSNIKAYSKLYIYSLKNNDKIFNNSILSI